MSHSAVVFTCCAHTIGKAVRAALDERLVKLAWASLTFALAAVVPRDR